MIYEFDGYKPVINPSSYVHKEATIIGNVIIGKDVYIKLERKYYNSPKLFLDEPASYNL